MESFRPDLAAGIKTYAQVMSGVGLPPETVNIAVEKARRTAEINPEGFAAFAGRLQAPLPTGGVIFNQNKF